MHEKPFILIVVNDLNIGGTERHLSRVLPSLVAKGFGIMVYTLWEKGALAEMMMKAGVDVVAPSIHTKIKSLRYMASLIQLTRILLKKKPDIVHFFLPRAYLIGSIAALLARSPRRVMSRRIIYSNDYQRSIYFRLEKYCHKYIDMALACSKEIYEALGEEGLTKDKRAIIYNGVDCENDLVFNDKKTVRLQLQLSEDILIMTIIANLHPRKGHRDLIHALASIKDGLPYGWKLLIVGRDDGEQEKLQDLSDCLGVAPHIVWLGQLEDVGPILAASDMGILCSHGEGFSNALLESMASGLPMVVTAVSGNVEAVCDGINGFVVPVQNPRQLAMAVLRLGKDNQLRQKMGQASRERVKQFFSLNKMILHYADFYQGFFQKTFERNAMRSPDKSP